MGCIDGDVDRGNGKAPKDESPQTLVAIVKGTNHSLQKRAEAAKQLRRVGSPADALALLDTLPGELDIVSLEVIYTVGEIGDERVLPKLKEIVKSPLDIPGKIGSALAYAIKRKELLRTVKSNAESSARRAEAATKLGELGSHQDALEMAKLLPGDFDVLTLAIIVAAEKRGDARVVPILKKLTESQSDIPGKINTALHNALKKLEQAK
jgi:HEAT repeat protein